MLYEVITEVDTAVLAVPARFCPDITLKLCRDKNTRGIIIISAGFSEESEEGAQAQGRILQEAAFGFRYIFARPSLLGLQLVFFFGNLGWGIALTAITPMVLLRRITSYNVCYTKLLREKTGSRLHGPF